MRIPRRAYPSGRMEAAINVTPLVDVCLVLLIIFMVVTPLMRGEIPLNLPEAASAGPLGEGHPRLTISLTTDGTLYAGGAVVRADEAQGVIAAAAGKDNLRPVVLRVDRETRYGDALRVLKLCRDAGFRDVGLATTTSAPHRMR